MDYARANGYPVPAVEEISDDGTELVIERLVGPSMVAAISRRPWTIRHQATVLADLHRRLHEIPGPDWLRPAVNFTYDGESRITKSQSGTPETVGSYAYDADGHRVRRTAGSVETWQRPCLTSCVSDTKWLSACSTTTRKPLLAPCLPSSPN